MAVEDQSPEQAHEHSEDEDDDLLEIGKTVLCRYRVSFFFFLAV
jgi:hypothetical protein